jgi:hypothetical protein
MFRSLPFALSSVLLLAACDGGSSSGNGGSGGATGGSGGATGGSGGATGGSGGAGGEPAPVVCTDQCVYVRPGAAGAGTGADWDDALAALPAELARGKVYLLADGDYGARTFGDAESGTEKIVVLKATEAGHGTDVGWQADHGDGVALFSGVSFDTAYYVLDGARGGGRGAWNEGHGIEIQRTGDACKDNGSLIGFGAGVSDVEIRHVHAHANNNDYPMTGVKGTYGASRLTFAYDSIHTTFGPAFHIGDWSDVVIEDSYLAEVRSTGAIDPFCPDWHAEGISSIGANEDITIRNNLWDRIDGTAVLAGVNEGSSTGWKVYGNVFSRSVTTIYYYNEPGTSNLQTMDGLEFHHNDVVHMPGTSAGSLVVQSGSNNRVFNNIWYDNIANTFSFGGVTHDHNFFAENRRVEGCDPPCDKDDEGAEGETDGQVSEGSPFVLDDMDPFAADFHLGAATKPGVTLPSPFDVDPDGETRGADGIWDRGAYEHGP